MSSSSPSARFIVFDDRDHPFPRTTHVMIPVSLLLLLILSLQDKREIGGRGRTKTASFPSMYMYRYACLVLSVSSLFVEQRISALIVVCCVAISFALSLHLLYYLSIYLSLSFYLVVKFSVSSHFSMLKYFRFFPLSFCLLLLLSPIHEWQALFISLQS